MKIALALILLWLLGNVVLFLWLGLEKAIELSRRLRSDFLVAIGRRPIHLPPALRETILPR
jgi:hypothetical protein